MKNKVPSHGGEPGVRILNNEKKNYSIQFQVKTTCKSFKKKYDTR